MLTVVLISVIILVKTEYNNNAHLPLDNFVVKCIMYKVIELQKPVWTATEGVSAEAPFFYFSRIYKLPSPAYAGRASFL